MNNLPFTVPGGGPIGGLSLGVRNGDSGAGDVGVVSGVTASVTPMGPGEGGCCPEDGSCDRICLAGGSGYLPVPGPTVSYSPGAANVGLEGIGPCGSCKS